ncbi:MAG: hypothetical protein ACRERV_08735 [Methylococcales bacterium]
MTFPERVSTNRRGWIAERIRQLAAIFAIDVAPFAVMSNSYYVVVRIDREGDSVWSVVEVLERWTVLFTDAYLVMKYSCDARSEMREAEIPVVMDLVAIEIWMSFFILLFLYYAERSHAFRAKA